MDLQEEFNKLDLPKSLVLGLVIAGIYYFLLYDNGAALDAQIAQARSEIQKNQAKLAQIKQMMADEKKYQQEVDTINKNMQDFLRYFSPDMDTNQLLTKVSTFAEEVGLTVNNLKPVETKSSEFPNYSEIAVEFEVESSFHKIMEFVARLTRMEKAIDFSKMNFATVKGKNEDRPRVSLKTTLVVYSANETGDGK